MTRRKGLDRDLDLVVGTAGRVVQPLEPEARREEGHQHAVVLVVARIPDDLVRKPGDDRQEQDPALRSASTSPPPTNAKTKIAITITQSKNAVPQRG